MHLQKVIVFVVLIAFSTMGKAVNETGTIEVTQNPSSISTECILVPSSQILLNNIQTQQHDTPPWKAALSTANHGHEIVAGHGYVLSVRQFQGADAPIDSAKFLKITLQLQLTELRLGESQEIRIPVLDGYYVQGAVGFVHKREYWQAHRPTPDIVLRRTATGLMATLQSTFTASYMANGESKPVHLDLTCGVLEAPADSLKAWEGKPGADWSSFAPKS